MSVNRVHSDGTLERVAGLGLGIKSVDIDNNGHLIVTYEDNTTHDAGLVEGSGNIFSGTEEEWDELTEEEQNQYDFIFITDDEETFCISIPEGGTAGQVLVKKSSEDYDAEWGDISNVLYGKKWCACGDSYTEGDFHGYVDPEGHTGHDSDAYDPVMGMYKTYPWWIAKRNNMDLVMRARIGQDFTNVTGALSPFSDSESTTNYTQIPSDADYVTIWYGLNEAGDLTEEQIGTKTDTTNETLWGAYNVVFSSILNNNPLAKIGVFISDGSQNGGITQAYHDAIIEICKYWAIPYLDLRNGVNVPMGLGGRLDECSNTSRLKRKEAFQVSPSNLHPNVNAHKYRSTFIENFLRSL